MPANTRRCRIPPRNRGGSDPARAIARQFQTPPEPRHLIHAAGLDLDRLEGRRALNMPGMSCTVAEQIESLRRAAGTDAVALIKPEPDETIARIVEGWPRDFAPERAAALDFAAESSFDEIVDIYIHEDLDPARRA